MKQKNIKRILEILLLIVIAPLTTYCQDKNEYVNVPPPNISSLFKFIEIPINYHTGQPDINIPIYTINEGGITFPIELRYHTASVKPDEQPTWVGLGWTLFSGGAITRNIMGLPDEEDNGYYKKPIDYMTDEHGYTQDAANWNWTGTVPFDRLSDGEPDVFMFQFNGYSGKFLINEEGLLIGYPYSELKIEFLHSTDDRIIIAKDPELVNPTNSFEHMFTGFKISTPEGLIYEFEEPIFSYPKGAQTNQWDKEVRVNTWMLTKIYSVNGNDEIVLSYKEPETDKYFLYQKLIPFNYHIIADGSVHFTKRQYYQNTLSRLKYLDKITTKTSKIEINFDELNKLDLQCTKVDNLNDFPIFGGVDNLYRGHKLNKIEIKFSDVIKEIYDFSYIENSNEKLKLKGISKKKMDQQVPIDIYKFEYSEQHMNYSSPTDHWGYFKEWNLDPLNATNMLNGRNVKKESTNVLDYPDLLKKIIYPTGGYSEYVFESNTFSTVADNLDYQCKLLEEEKGKYNGSHFYDYYMGDDADPISFNIDNGTPIFIKLFFRRDDSGNFAVPACYCEQFNCVFDLWYPIGKIETLSNLMNYGLASLAPHIPEPNNSCEDSHRTGYDASKDGTLSQFWMAYSYYVNSLFEYAGGVRVKFIKNIDPVSEDVNIREFKYILEDENLSSGVISTMPKYEKETPVLRHWSFVPINSACASITLDNLPAKYYNYSTKPTNPISLNNGYHVEYSRVVEKTSGNGRKEYTFTTFLDYPDIIGSSEISDLIVDKAHFRGKIISEKIFAENEVNPIIEKTYNYEKITPLNNQYSPIAQRFSNFIFLGDLGEEVLCGGDGGKAYSNNYFYDISYNYMDQSFLVLKTIDEINSGVSKFHQFVYGANLLAYPSEISVSTLNEKVVTYNYYVGDFLTNNQTSPIFKLQQNNMNGLLVETYSYHQNGGVALGFNGSVNKYSDIDTQLGLVSEIYRLESNLGDNYTRSSNYSDDLSNFDADYKQKIKFEYSSYGKINQINSIDKVISYIWGYNNSYPIIKADYINYTSLNSIFESVLASYYATVNPPTTKESFLNDMLLQPDGTNWQNFNNLLRSHPSIVGKFISTYTYDPLIGMTSETDPNGKTTYYEYDSFGRLKCTRDHNGFIVKQYEYHYKPTIIEP